MYRGMAHTRVSTPNVNREVCRVNPIPKSSFGLNRHTYAQPPSLGKEGDLVARGRCSRRVAAKHLRGKTLRRGPRYADGTAQDSEIP